MKLRTKMILTYILIVLLSVTLISALANAFFDNQFKNYIIQNQIDETKNIMSMLQQQYTQENGWLTDRIESIGADVIDNGYIIKLYDSKGNAVWDATHHNEGKCNAILVQMASNMSSRYPGWQGKIETKKFSLQRDFKEIGTVEITYYGPYFYTEHDLKFINSLNRILLGVGIFSTLVSIMIGVFISSRISNPILSIIRVTQMLSKGSFNNRVELKSSTQEIVQLGDNINLMAASLEKQENLRKRLTADVSHELRTPLATLQSHMEAMIDAAAVAVDA